MFIPDEPASSIKDDKLGRANFAMKLAQVLHEWEREESIVVGLYGTWGSGKTSLVNMILEQIQQLSTQDSISGEKPTFTGRFRNYFRPSLDSSDRVESSSSSEDQQGPIIVHFNPWYFSNTDELLQAFFAQVFAAISSRSAKFRRFIEKRLKSYGTALEKTEKLPAVGGFMSGVGGFLNIAIREESLSDSREKLNEAFRDLERKVIIVIDDLDRLRQAEIRQMLQVVKLNANFPNTIYLLAADREVIEKSLETEQGISGRDYLEKIVQAGFDIPPIDPSYISDLLTEEISRALAGYEGPIDNRRWADIYQGGFRNFFLNLRDVKRFLSSLSFNYLLVSSEINIEDFICLEALRVFVPEVYETIAENKRLFTSFWVWGKRDELRPLFDEIFAQGDSYAEICRNIAIALFPQINFVYYSTAYSPEYLNLWRKAKRICVPENFDVYFMLGVPVGEISQAELAQLRTDARDYQQLKTIFQNIVESGRYRRLLEKLDNTLDELDAVAAQNLCTLLLELGDELPDEPTGFLDVGPGWLVARLIYRLLWKMGEGERCEWLKEQIISNASLYTVLQQLSIAESKLEGKEEDEIIFNDACLQELKQASVSRIESEANAKLLEPVRNLNFILTTWRDWAATSDNLRAYVQHMIQTPDRAVTFLTGFLGRVDSYTGNTHSVTWRINLQELEQFIDPHQLVPVLSLLLEGSQLQELSEKEHQAVKAFTEALQSLQEEE